MENEELLPKLVRRLRQSRPLWFLGSRCDRIDDDAPTIAASAAMPLVRRACRPAPSTAAAGACAALTAVAANPKLSIRRLWRNARKVSVPIIDIYLIAAIASSSAATRTGWRICL